MATLSLSINGRSVTAEVEPRTHLADFLRSDQHLTGTHLGCEQGVCGACTVLIDGKPQRACLTFAIDCDGADVRSIEGFENDLLMNELRAAFSKFHALQCGFCTPGMLASARDIVSRLGEVSEKRIRLELSGNICRCTGYVGIVEAIRSVSLGKAPESFAVAAAATRLERLGADVVIRSTETAPTSQLGRSKGEGGSLEERIVINAPPEEVWGALSDLRRVAPCVPGAEITEIDGELIKGRVKMALGPIKPSFRGEARVSLNPAAREGKMTGLGRDKGTGSSAEGEASWRVIEGPANGSVVVVSMNWRLTGMLSQFNRSSIVRDVVRGLATAFAANLEAMLKGDAPPPSEPESLNVLQLIWSMIRQRLFGRS
ncbi:xanthine dehydrogenase family Fe-S subunit [Bradyrhizobium acaciae]|uniref:xanthine dehydrogenase family Fe-S subunit n=1 Tax=Bradyrhizobium acaciae TaxID=2683706 RepID=UPI001E434607|nr:2Fe-2S iron-sulfur cluster-binding protein [Bradyrhizobium acaciae]MCC8977376.1 2Fe-2S iron-sulfur cluster binding domain-containing protein [Bradyrhizobium acaciae]